MNLVETAPSEFLALLQAGVARSTEALSRLSGARWDIDIISIDVGSSTRFSSIMARDEREYTGAYFLTPGERYLVMFSEESGKTLVRSYSHDRLGMQALNERLERSSLAEIANILISGLSGALADRQGMWRLVSAPNMVVGRKSDICAQAFGDFRSFGDDVMVDALIHVSSPSLAADCTLMLRLDSVTANFLMTCDPDASPAAKARLPFRP